ncbi:titin-like [Branchiostoma floridae]|uniref:Titin-like n=1 Tax=Branchiostoma floridae TaxID=7739 RepID=A0A9J7M4H5_BRAFL|nr:titin-like [Branchiostoma floridae]
MDLGGITPVEAIGAMPVSTGTSEDEIEEETSNVPTTEAERLQRAKEFLLLLGDTETELEIIKEEDFWRDSDSTMSSESGVMSDSEDGANIGNQNVFRKPPQRGSDDPVDTDSSDEVEPLNSQKKPSRSKKKKRPPVSVNNEDNKGESSDEVEPLYPDEGVPLSPSPKPKRKKPTVEKAQDPKPTDDIPTDPTSFYEKLSALPQNEAPGTAEGVSSPEDNRSQAESGIGHEPGSNGERPVSPFPDDEEVEPEDDYVPPEDKSTTIAPPRSTKRSVATTPKPVQRDDTSPPTKTTPSQPSNGSKRIKEPNKKSDTTPKGDSTSVPEDDGFFGNLLKKKKGRNVPDKQEPSSTEPSTKDETDNDEKPGLLDNLLNKLKPKATGPEDNVNKDDSKRKHPVDDESPRDQRKPETNTNYPKTEEDENDKPGLFDNLLKKMKPKAKDSEDTPSKDGSDGSQPTANQTKPETTAKDPKTEEDEDDKPGLFDNLLKKIKPKPKDSEDTPSNEYSDGRQSVEKDSRANQKKPVSTSRHPDSGGSPEPTTDKDDKLGLLDNLLSKLKPKDREDDPSKRGSKPTENENNTDPDKTDSSDRQPDKPEDAAKKKPSEGVLDRLLKTLHLDEETIPPPPEDQSTDKSTDEPSQGQKPKTALPGDDAKTDEPAPIPPPRTKSLRKRPTTLPVGTPTEKDNKQKDAAEKRPSKKPEEKNTSSKPNGSSKPAKGNKAPLNPMLVFGIVPMEFEDVPLTPPCPRKKQKPAKPTKTPKEQKDGEQKTPDDKTNGSVLGPQEEESDTLGSFLDYVFGRPKDRKTPVARPKIVPKPEDATKPKDKSPSDTIPTKKEEPSPAVKSLQGLLERSSEVDNKATETPKDEPAKSKPAKESQQPKDEPQVPKETEKPKDEPKPSKETEKPKEETKPSKEAEKSKEEPKPTKVTEQPKDDPATTKPVKETERPKNEPTTSKPDAPDQKAAETRPIIEKPSEDKAAPPSPRPKSTKEKKTPKTPSPKVRKSSKNKEPTEEPTKKKTKEKKPAKDKTKSRKKSEEKPVNADPPKAQEPPATLQNVEPVKAAPPAPQIPQKIEDEPVFAAPPQAKENLPTSPRSRKPSKTLLSKLKKLKDGLTHDISSDNEVESPETKRKELPKVPDTPQKREEEEPEKVEPPPRRKRDDKSMSPPPQKRQEKTPDTTPEKPVEIPTEMPTPPPRHKKDVPETKDNEEPVKAESPPPEKEEEKEPVPIQEQVEQEPVKAAPPQPQEEEKPSKPEKKEDVTPVAVEAAAPQQEEPVKAAPPVPQPQEDAEAPKQEEKEDVTPVTVEPAAPQPEEVKKAPEQVEPEPVTSMPPQPQEKIEPVIPEEKEEPSIPDKEEDIKPETIEEPVPQKEATVEEEKEPDTTEPVTEERPVETEPEKPKEEDKEDVPATVEEKPPEDETKDEPTLEDQHISEPTESVPTESAPPLPPRRSKGKKEDAPTDAEQLIVPEEQTEEENDNKPDRIEPPPLPVKRKSQRSEEQLPSPVDENKYPEISFSDAPPLQTNLDDIFHSPDDVLNAPCKGSDDDVPKEEEQGIVPDELAPVKTKKRSESFKAGRDRLKALGKSLKNKATRRKSDKSPDEDKPEPKDDPDNIVEEVDTPSSPQEEDSQKRASLDRLKALGKSLKDKTKRRKSEKSPDEEEPETKDDPDNIVEEVDTPSSPQEPDSQTPGARDRLKALGKSLKDKAKRRKSEKSPDEDKPEMVDEPENPVEEVGTPSSPQEPDSQKTASLDRLKALGKSLKDKTKRRKSDKSPDDDEPETKDDPDNIVEELDTPSSPQEPDSQTPGSLDRLKALRKSLKEKAKRRKSDKTPDEGKPEMTDDPEEPVPEITDDPDNSVDTPSSPQEPESQKPKKPSRSLLSKLKDGLLSDSEKELTPHVQKKPSDVESDEPVTSKAADQEDMATPGPSHQPDEIVDTQDEAPTKPEKKKINLPRKLSKLRNSFKRKAKSKSDDGPKSDLEGDAIPDQDDENKENAPSLEDPPKDTDRSPDSPSALKFPESTSPNESFSTVIENFAAQEDPGQEEDEPVSKPLDEPTEEEDNDPEEAWSPWFKDTPKTEAPSDVHSSPVLEKKPKEDAPTPLIEDQDDSLEVPPKLPPKQKDLEEPSDKEDNDDVPIWEKIKPLEETCVKCRKVLKDSDVVVNFNGLILHQACMS